MTRPPVSPDIKTFVDKGFSCWNGGEIDLMAEAYADDAEVDTTTAVPDGRCYKGREEFVRFFHEQWDAWDHLRMDPLDVADVGGGRHVVEVRLTGTGRSSGIEIDQRMGFLYTLRAQDGKVARVQMFPSKDAALEAAGLRE
ncbi:MAG: nuclear transport factor 2 family protein [Chloroflexota bacterium]|nr:nuclear transport factor 2 family protein [Chloroflexota bacterium]